MTRMSMLSKVLLVVTVALLIVGVAAIIAQPGPGGGRPGGRGAMGAMMYLERAWGAVNFELDATDEQIAELKPIFQSAYDARKEAIAKARAEQNIQGLMAALQQGQSDIDAALNEVLTDEQLAEWEQLKQATQAGMGLGFGRRGGAQQ